MNELNASPAAELWERLRLAKENLPKPKPYTIDELPAVRSMRASVEIPEEAVRETPEAVDVILRVLGVGGVVLTPVAAYAQPYLLGITVPCGAVFGGWFVVRWWGSPRQRARRPLAKTLSECRQETGRLRAALEEVYRRSRDEKMERHTAAEGLLDRIEQSDAERMQELRRAGWGMRDRYYATPSLKQAASQSGELTSFFTPLFAEQLDNRAIRNAGDILNDQRRRPEEQQIRDARKIPQDVRERLIRWARQKQVDFEHDPSIAVDARMRGLIVRKFAEEKEILIARVRALIAEVETPDPDLPSQVAEHEPSIFEAMHREARANAELDFFDRNT